MPFYPFFGEGPPTKIDVLTKVGTLLLSSLLEDLETQVLCVERIPFQGKWLCSSSGFLGFICFLGIPMLEVNRQIRPLGWTQEASSGLRSYFGIF